MLYMVHLMVELIATDMVSLDVNQGYSKLSLAIILYVATSNARRFAFALDTY